MGIEFYVQGYRDGQPSGLDAERVRAIFGVSGPGPVYPLAYDATHRCDLSLGSRNGPETSFAILKPCDHPALWQALFAVLSEGPYVLFAPDCTAPVAVGRLPICQRVWPTLLVPRCLSRAPRRSVPRSSAEAQKNS